MPPRRTPAAGSGDSAGTDDSSTTGAGEAVSAADVQAMIDKALEGKGPTGADPDRRYTRVEMEEFAAAETAKAQKALETAPPKSAPPGGGGDPTHQGEASDKPPPPAGATGPADSDRRKVPDRRATAPPAPPAKEASPAGVVSRGYKWLFGEPPPG